VLTGYTESPYYGETGDLWLIRTDATGDTLWTRTYSKDDSNIGYSVQQTGDGGFVVAGWTASFDVGAGDVYLIRTDANGYTLWTRTYGGEDEDIGRSVQQTSDGGFVVAGYTYSFGAARGTPSGPALTAEAAMMRATPSSRPATADLWWPAGPTLLARAGTTSG